MASATAIAEGEIELISMWVSRAARGCGVGEALIGAAATWAIAQGASKLVLKVRAENHFAISLYSKTGFRGIEPTTDAAVALQERQMVRELT
jgi:ribosomal protein S18 acetylase RimI-like enzyme